jgi:hypothetical protein
MRKNPITLEEVVLFVEENQIQNPVELAKINKPYYNFIYRNRVTEKIPFTRKKVFNQRDYEKDFKENRTKDWYDIERLLPYLEHFADIEGTTVEDQCVQCYLLPEWEDFKQKNPNYPL